MAGSVGLIQSKILVVDDETNILKILKVMLESEGYDVRTASNVQEAKEYLRKESYRAVLTDMRLKREDGLWLLKWVKEEGYSTPVIILTAHGTIDSAVDAMKQGAFDYIGKPFDRAELVRVIRKAVLSHQFQTLQMPKKDYPILGESEKMKQVFHFCEKVSGTDSTVLITGESGTGKELVAQVVHDKSSRNNNPFIKINCAAIPPTLMESELFGHERGAFTGAFNSKPGRFELADKGTLFLDEIAEMSTEMQVKLLRVLQDGRFERVGGIRSLQADVRLIAATNRPLEKMVKEGKFREDLYYRLNVVPILLPPLRERPEDIPILTAYFLKKCTERMKKKMVFSPEALELLMRYSWPGNIRQLENVIERLVVVGEGEWITEDHLPEEVRRCEDDILIGDFQNIPASLKERVKDATRKIERQAIEKALQETQFNVTQAAKQLKLSRKGLQLKMKELGLRD